MPYWNTPNRNCGRIQQRGYKTTLNGEYSCSVCISLYNLIISALIIILERVEDILHNYRQSDDTVPDKMRFFSAEDLEKLEKITDCLDGKFGEFGMSLHEFTNKLSLQRSLKMRMWKWRISITLIAV